MAAYAAERPDVSHYQGATDQEKDAVELVASCVDSFEKGVGLDFRHACNERFRQYRGFRRFRDAWTAAGPNDRDGVVYDAQKHWGAHLHIPLSYRTIETMVPRSIAHRPRMLYLPRQEQWAENVEAVRLLIDAQQENIDIDLPFQAVMRSGRIYGLGVGKTFWRKEYAARRRVERRMFAGGLLNGVFSPKYQVGKVEATCTFDDPDFEDVDVFDFMWDPMGSDMRTCGWVVHRSWLSVDGCLERMRRGLWNTPSVKRILEGGREVEEIQRQGSAQRYDDVWAERMEASGFSSFNLSTRGEHPHEVLEWHDGNQVYTVLDRSLFVQDAENQCVGTKPFQVYRPTPLQKQMVGIGDLEPIEHLQRELDTLRSQRRDAATIALAAGWIFDSGMVDEEDLAFGPAAAIEVRNSSDVRNAIMQIPVRDVPGSSYEEEKVIKSDAEGVVGLNDAMDPSQGQISTATQAQLVQASLSARIALGSRRFEIEVVRQAARCFLHLNQRMILDNRDPIRQPDHGLDLEQAAREGRWRWVDIGPGSLRGEFETVPEGGSMAARNIQQDRQDAVQMMSIFGQHPNVEPSRPLMKALELFGVRDPEAWLKKAEPPVPPLALEALKRMGVDPRLIERAVTVAQRQDPQLAPDGQQGPSPADVGQMMAAGVAA